MKTHHLTHQDLGQTQMYVNFYDRKIKQDDDNPTLGLVLCTEKNDDMVHYTLSEENKQIFASKYQFYLPTNEELQSFVKAEVEELIEEA